MAGILLPDSKRGINVPQDESKISHLRRPQFAANLAAGSENDETRHSGGFGMRYRYGDSNPGFRRERAAS
jgi:hypothetical protein